MYYPEEIVEEVRSSNDIVDVIGSYVRLQKKGGSYMGLCPFHNEKSPSFAVSQTKQMYHCFGCGVGGNVFTFLMEYENFTFAESLKFLAERAGIRLPEREQTDEERRTADIKSRLLDVHKDAAKYYYYKLKSDRGVQGLEYLKNRALTDETITKFGLGYSDKYPDDLYQYLKGIGYDDGLLSQSGLVTINEKGVYDKFWNRVMFPIMDANSKVIAFGGRVMGEGEPKYLNSPETLIFDKSRNLYGLNVARHTKRPYFLLCEGYMDVIALHQAGFTNAVASLGTAFTPQHARIIARYVKEVMITYDSDGAGIKAALRAIPILKEAGISAKIVNMQPYKDPDEFIKALGAEEYEKRIENAVNSFFFRLDVLQKDYNLDDPEQKTKFFNETAKLLLQFSEEIERNNYIEAVSKKYNVSYENLRRLVNKFGAVQTDISVASQTRQLQQKQRESRNTDGMNQSVKLLLTWLIEDRSVFDKIKGIIEVEDFCGEPYSQVAGMVFKQYEEEGMVSPAKIISRFESSEKQSEVAALFSAALTGTMDETQKRKAFADTVVRVKTISLESQYRQAIENNDFEKLQLVMEEQKNMDELKKQLNTA